ncbi:DinB family protein [Silvibacterium acidisoli]|uniref:DinB family protein n=1 Tax=Acidobacteriaceae bacterium ZG23-2 TaxID=2883246 RepID=UPI00406C73D4
MTNEEILVGTVIHNWSVTMSRLKTTLDAMTDAEFESEVAPGRNRVHYLVGHLAAFQDRLNELIGMGGRLHPELDVFISNPDRSFNYDMSRAQLTQILWDLVAITTEATQTRKSSEWLERHNAVSAEDFAKEPLRNRLAILDGRATHVALHHGQMRLALKRK